MHIDEEEYDKGTPGLALLAVCLFGLLLIAGAVLWGMKAKADDGLSAASMMSNQNHGTPGAEGDDGD